MMTRWVAGVAVLFGILLMMLPKTDEESVARIASASMLMCTLELREEIEAQVIRGEPVSVEPHIGCPDLIAGLDVNEEGVMVITGREHPVRMTLSPRPAGDGVRWSCHAESEQSVTKLCKP